MTAEASCKDNPIEARDAQPDFLEQRLAATVDGALGANEIADIDLRQDNIPVNLGFVLPGQHVFIYAIDVTNAGGIEVTIEFSQVVDDTHLKQIGRHVDQPRPADAFGADIANGQVHGLKGMGINRKVLDSAFHCPHSELNPAALEGRPGRAGRAGQPVPVADHDLSIGADVDIKGQQIGEIDTRTH